MRIIGLLIVAALAAFGMLAAGCGSRSEGQLGHASFAWQECPFGCSVTDNPMASGGARAQISVSLASGYSFQQIRSSNSAVATFAIGGGSSSGLNVSVTSGAAGRTDLQLIDGKGKLVDQVTITVTATAKLTQTRGWTGAAPLVLEGSTQLFHVTTKDANDHTLIGTGAVAFELSDPLRTADAIVFGDTVGFTGHAGAGTITARCDSSTVVQPVTVVPLDALTTVAVAALANSTEGTSVYANVDVVANSAAGPVYGAPCGWTANDASVVVQSQTSASLESTPKSTTKFLLKSPGTFSATCAIGAVSTTVQLHR